MKTQITVEIPDGYEITSLYRGNQYGEHDDRSAAIPYTIHIRPAKPFLINGVPSDWPELLTASYVAKDQNGKVFAFDSEPFLRAYTWSNDRIASCLSGVISIDIPGPWEQSLRENPRRKK